MMLVRKFHRNHRLICKMILRKYSSTFRHQNASSPCLNQSISRVFFNYSISMSTNHLFWSPILNDWPDAGNKFPWITITYNSGRSVTRQLGRAPMIFCQFEPNSCENIRWFQSHFRFGHNTTQAIVIAAVPWIKRIGHDQCWGFLVEKYNLIQHQRSS